jgi:isochorismate hydrolase
MIKLLRRLIYVADVTAAVVADALADLSIDDFEDGLEYYAAKRSGGDLIVTEDKEDFYFSDIKVLDSETFFERYLARL